jgi:DNA-binding NtrC family response regulator
MAGTRQAARYTILSVSPDPGLLLSRSQVLKSAGYDVIAAINRRVAIVAAANRAVDLAILCHAFSEEESDSIEHDLHTVHPGMAVLQLHDHERMEMREQGLGPELFLHMVRAALTCRAR